MYEIPGPLKVSGLIQKIQNDKKPKYSAIPETAKHSWNVKQGRKVRILIFLEHFAKKTKILPVIGMPDNSIPENIYFFFELLIAGGYKEMSSILADQ
jgi:hypothetical protein